MAAENVFVKEDEEGSKPTIFPPKFTLDAVARRFKHDRSSGLLDVKTTAGGLFIALPLETVLHELGKQRNLQGNGTQAEPFIVQVERTDGAGVGAGTETSEAGLLAALAPVAPPTCVSQDATSIQPSSLAHPHEWSRVQAASHDCLQPFLCGRPFGSTWHLPLCLVDQMLGSVRKHFRDADVPPPGSEPLCQEECEAVMGLLSMADNFADDTGEQRRVYALEKVLHAFLGQKLLALASLAADAVLLQNPAENELPLLLLEAKNELGSNGDPYFEGQVHYQRALRANSKGQGPVAGVVYNTACPCLLLEVVGPLLRVCAVASVQDVQVICEPLTPFLHLIDVRIADLPHMLRLGRVLRALKESIRLMREAYGQLLRSAAAPPPPLEPLAKRPRKNEAVLPMTSDVALPREPSLVLPHPLRAGLAGPAYTGDQKSYARVEQVVLTGRPLPLYRCTADDGSSVLVKYVFDGRYGGVVHKSWAEHGLAPKLLSITPLDGGALQVVMEDLQEDAGWRCFALLPAELRQQMSDVVLQALEAAHNVVVGDGKGVHADARASNVMVNVKSVAAAFAAAGASTVPEASLALASERRVCFVDFDWAGVLSEQSQVRLPAFARQRCGKGSGQVVTQEYDMQLWQETWQSEGLVPVAGGS